MLSEQQRIFTANLKQSILRLCHDGLPHIGKIEVDGLICIHVEDEAQDVIVKIHESLYKTGPVASNALMRGTPPAQARWPPTLSLQTATSASRCSANSDLELRDLLSQSRYTQLGDRNNATPDQISDGGEEEDEPYQQNANDDGNESTEIIQAPLYKQLWDKYKSSGNGGSTRRGMKVPQAEPSLVSGASVVLPCKICRTMITGVEKLEKHYLSVHKVYMCKQCFRTFSMYSNMKRHMRLHTGQRPYRCTLCGKTFTRKDDLTNHILKHKDSKPFTCGMCKKGYTERSSIRGHLRRDHNANTDDVHICTQCGMSYAALHSFMEHLKTHSKTSTDGHFAFVQEHSSVDLTQTDPERGSSAEVGEGHEDVSGQEETKRESVLLDDEPTSLLNVTTTEGASKHLLDVVVSRPDGSPCSVSVKVGHLAVRPDEGSSDSSSPTLDPGQGSPTPKSKMGDNYECNHCNTSYTSYAELSHHVIKQHGKYCCVHCPQLDFDSTDDLNDHMSHHHHDDDLSTKENGDRQESEVANLLQPKEEPMESTEVDLTPSVKIKREIPDDDDEEEMDPSNEGSPFSAFTSLSQPVFPGSPLNYSSDRNFSAPSHGASDFAMSKSVDSHSFGRIIEMKNTYPTSGSPPKKQRTSSVKQPSRDHQGEPRCLSTYVCSVCKSVFVNTDEFLNHCTDAHQRFGCKYCGQMFTQCGNRNRHLRYHSGDRPFVCPECGDTFARQDALKNHIDARHKKSSCPICGLTFSKPSLASQHLKNEHGVCN